VNSQQRSSTTQILALGRLAEAQKDLDDDEKYYREALMIFEKLGARPYVELAKKDLERIQQLKGRK